MPAEIKLDGRRIYDGKILNLRVDRVALPGGGQAIREVVEFHGGVAIVALDAAGRVLLVRQYRYAVGRDLLELPAGILERGEQPIECAARELEEETGYCAARIEPLCRFYSTPGGTDEVLHIFLASELTPGPPRPEADERIEVLPTAWDDALALVRRGEICDGKTVIGLLMADSRRAEQ
jgi:ADP-ribose pyrophosphatase